MDIRELKQRIDCIVEHMRDYEDIKVVVEVKGSGIGGTPCVNVTGASLGFDWDSGKFILQTEGKLLKRE